MIANSHGNGAGWVSFAARQGRADVRESSSGSSPACAPRCSPPQTNSGLAAFASSGRIGSIRPSQSGSVSTPETLNIPTVPFGWAAFRPAVRLGHRFPLRRRLHTRLPARLRLTEQRLRLGHGTPHIAQPQHLHHEQPSLIFNLQRVTQAHFAGWLRRMPVRIDTIQLASL